MKPIALLLFSMVLLPVQLSLAIREGTATAEVFIRRYTRAGDFGRLALWHEAAADCLTRISVPMNEIAHAYYTQYGYERWAGRAEKEAWEIQKQRQGHRALAETAWEQFAATDPDPHAFSRLETERRHIAQFLEIWLPRYPHRFYEYGIYPTFFRARRESALQEGRYAEALRLEADAAEMCARQYQRIPIAYGLERYEKFRDAYLRHARYLRDLAAQNPRTLPPEIDAGKQVLGSLETPQVPSQETAAVILQIARSDPCVKAAVAGQNGVHAYPSFQGFAWVVRFSSHSRGNFATVIIDTKTLKVLEVCVRSPAPD